jgi:hypothetical protein
VLAEDKRELSDLCGWQGRLGLDGDDLFDAPPMSDASP